jgi:hypothetical protein
MIQELFSTIKGDFKIEITTPHGDFIVERRRWKEWIEVSTRTNPRTLVSSRSVKTLEGVEDSAIEFLVNEAKRGGCVVGSEVDTARVENAALREALKFAADQLEEIADAVDEEDEFHGRMLDVYEINDDTRAAAEQARSALSGIGAGIERKE